MKPVALIILDGWGWREAEAANAVRLARTPIFNQHWNNDPHTLLAASGLAVGLPDGVMGNSEVGHLNIGAGRVVYQDLTRISESVRAGHFANNPTLQKLFATALACGNRLHLAGLLSDGGVHSHIDHVGALLDAAKAAHIAQVFLHVFLDGRDTAPHGGVDYVRTVQKKCAAAGNAQIASVCGRYFAMDRDQRWERTERAYAAIVHGRGAAIADAASAIEASYARGVTDEFFEPAVVMNGAVPVGAVQSGDAMLFWNFRSDRPRQICRALALPDFAEFDRGNAPPLVQLTTMTAYHQDFPFPTLFAPQSMQQLLGDVVSAAGKKQLRIAETEKYAHVTFFFNGGRETPGVGEERCLIPSPKEVATYDLKPEMSAEKIADEVVARIAAKKYDLIILNFANPDMVGHTGVLAAAIRAVETTDACLGRVLTALAAVGGVAIVTADHGNCEVMANPDGSPNTAHTTNLVPCILVGGEKNATLRDGGKLCDLASSLLHLMEISQPVEMTGCSLIEEKCSLT